VVGFETGSEGVVGGVTMVGGGMGEAAFVGKSSSSMSMEGDRAEDGSEVLVLLADGKSSSKEETSSEAFRFFVMSMTAGVSFASGGVSGPAMTAGGNKEEFGEASSVILIFLTTGTSSPGDDIVPEASRFLPMSLVEGVLSIGLSGLETIGETSLFESSPKSESWSDCSSNSESLSETLEQRMVVGVGTEVDALSSM
jgi:hypothetical protein